MRLVLDTNVVIAGMLWRGSPRQLLEAAVDGSIRLATSAALLDELAQALRHPKLSRKLSEQGLSAGAIVARYALMSDTVAPASIAPAVPSDSDDDKVLGLRFGCRSGPHCFWRCALTQPENVPRYCSRHRG